MWILPVLLVVWVLLTGFLSLVGFILDEDVNVWNWPEDRNGPSHSVTIRIVAISAVLAAVPIATVAWLAARSA